MSEQPSVILELQTRFGADAFVVQPTRDALPTLWVARERLREVLAFLKRDLPQPYRLLFDLTAIDERNRARRPGQPPSVFTVVYHLLSYERNADVRLKVALAEDDLWVPTISDLCSSANWYERELWDMFGIKVEGHPNLRRILMPTTWVGHPLRKDHPARATEMGPFELTDERQEEEQDALRFRPEEWGLQRRTESEDFLFLNVGPQHPGTHGPFRVVLQLDGEEIVDAVPDIGFHHRGAEKMGERQSWHTYIPYTDRVDYLGGVLNNLAYLMPLEQLAGITVPDRAKVIRVMLCELFRLSNHLVFYGTFAQDLGSLSPVFFMFNDRERVLGIVEAICGFRMHPGWFRIGGVAADLPRGWEGLVADLLAYLPKRLDLFDKMVLDNAIFQGRTVGVGKYNTDEAIEWSITGQGLRATGLAWDFRKARPYSGYEWFDFEVPTHTAGDCWARAWVHSQEMRQSLRIIEQCLKNMPAGPYKAAHPLTTPPIKEPNTMHDIETLITHFLGVTWGPVIPEGEACYITETAKGATGYYLISDGDTIPYRLRIRTPSFAHLQMIPTLVRGFMIPDLAATLGSIDFVMSDVDR
ncbi:MAG: NADH-quinone oxidoreductase subunit C/D [Chloroflexota bacterium]